MVTLNTRPRPVEIDPARSAVIVVDMQNGFASKGGMFDIAGIDISLAAETIAVNQRLLQVARRAGMHIVYLQMGFSADLSGVDDPDLPVYHKELALMMMRSRPDLRGKLLTEGGWDWQIVDELKPQPGDVVVGKTRYSGFARTGLEAHLNSLGIRHVFMTGIATNICVESTARDAYFRDFWPIMVEDAMNQSGPRSNQVATIWNFEHALGWVTDSAEVTRALGASEASSVAAE